MRLDEYIRELEDVEKSLASVVAQLVKEESTYLVGNVKLRFWNYGLDGRGNHLGHYAPYTFEKKQMQGARSSHVTLRDTGNWWDSLFAVYENEELKIESSMPGLTEKLVEGEGTWFEGYGEGIMEFSREEIAMFEKDIYKRVLERLSHIVNPNIDIPMK